MRRLNTAAVVAAVLVVGLIPLASLGLWAQRDVVGTAAFVRLADRVLEQAPVQAEVTDAVVDELESDIPELAGQRASLRPIVARVLRTSGVRQALAVSLARTHAQLRDDHDPLQLDLNPVLPIVRQQLRANLAAEIPPGATLEPVTVLRRRDAPAVWVGVELVQGLAVVISLATIALLLFAVFAARQRALVCVALGTATAIVSLLLILLVEPGRSILEHQAGNLVRRGALRAGYDTAMHPFVVQTLILAIVGVIIAIVGLFLVRSGRSRRRLTPSPTSTTTSARPTPSA